MIPLFRDPKHWRARAAETRATVEQFADPESKRLILWIADEYEILAERTDADLNKLSSKIQTEAPPTRARKAAAFGHVL
jgi:hypothetical protein